MRVYSLALSNRQSWCIVDTTRRYPLLKELSETCNLSICGQPFFPAVILAEGVRIHSEAAITKLASQLHLPLSNWHHCYSQDAEWWVADTVPAQTVCALPPALTYRRFPQQFREVISGILFCVYWHQLVEGGIPLHAALLEHRGRAALIVAPGGTGKTTCYQRVPPPWRGVCDEEVLVVPTSSGVWRAHPMINITDFAVRGKRIQHDIQRGYPLEGLFFLEQGSADTVTALGQGEAAARLFRAATEVIIRYRGWHCYQRNAFRLHQFANASTLACGVSCYKLTATLTGKFWKKMEPTLLHELSQYV